MKLEKLDQDKIYLQAMNQEAEEIGKMLGLGPVEEREPYFTPDTWDEDDDEVEEVEGDEEEKEVKEDK